MLTKKAKDLYDSLKTELGSSQADLLDELLAEIEHPVDMPRLYNRKGESEEIDFDEIANNYINGNLKTFREQVEALDIHNLASFIVHNEYYCPELTAGEIAKQLGYNK